MRRRLEITVDIPCKVSCSYCPQQNLKKSYKSKIKTLSLTTFKKCIDKLSKKVDIHFSGYCEPFQNKQILHMIEYVHKKGHQIVCYTTLNGLKKNDLKRLYKIPFKIFVVHVSPNQTKKSKALLWEMSNSKMHYDVVVVGVDEPLISRAGNLPVGKQVMNAGKIKCDRIYQNVLLPNGDVYLCCQDYSLKHKLGNLLQQSYKSLFKSKEFKKAKRSLKDDTYITLCRKCSKAVGK